MSTVACPPGWKLSHPSFLLRLELWHLAWLFPYSNSLSNPQRSSTFGICLFAFSCLACFCSFPLLYRMHQDSCLLLHLEPFASCVHVHAFECTLGHLPLNHFLPFSYNFASKFTSSVSSILHHISCQHETSHIWPASLIESCHACCQKTRSSMFFTLVLGRSLTFAPPSHTSRGSHHVS